MLINHPFDELTVVHERGRALRTDAAAERARGARPLRHALAVALRHVADRLDRARLAPRPELLRGR
jgi:hypothetical protein